MSVWSQNNFFFVNSPLALNHEEKLVYSTVLKQTIALEGLSRMRGPAITNKGSSG